MVDIQHCEARAFGMMKKTDIEARQTLNIVGHSINIAITSLVVRREVVLTQNNREKM